MELWRRVQRDTDFFFHSRVVSSLCFGPPRLVCIQPDASCPHPTRPSEGQDRTDPSLTKKNRATLQDDAIDDSNNERQRKGHRLLVLRLCCLFHRNVVPGAARPQIATARAFLRVMGAFPSPSPPVVIKLTMGTKHMLKAATMLASTCSTDQHVNVSLAKSLTLSCRLQLT